ncbi:thiamine pyrophosphate-dependent enzyme [Candidatus Deianiraea vastatrix]|uniref:Thiamine pyrophosphate-binding domain n=1 Tax=Candidatus Deianiraea vastatrix TaxID=2163644 RepID=A0A5B8XEG5_9RICK|nr:thiamine pyrophosphate-dependent enzyme [Candidatus Deianiraea vastatrix]QED23366.1 Putative thiamine pyrophosphate-binding domain [Candidatus Deianiraea vastatrix]
MMKFNNKKSMVGQKILSGVGYGSMGCSIPYAIGACYAAENKKQIISFSGDGGFQMNMQELMLIADKNLNIKIIIFNNNGLGLIRESQDRYMNSRYFGTNEKYVKCPQMDILSKAYGLSYVKIKKIEDCKTIKDLFNDNKSCIIEVIVDSSQRMYKLFCYNIIRIKFIII